MSVLQKIAEVEIDDIRLDLAKNSEYCLVWQRGPDAYGRPVAEKVDLLQFLGLADTGAGRRRVQALLDLLGDALVRLGQQRDARLGREEVRDGE